MMEHRIAAGASLACALLVSSVFAAEALQSGPQPGDKVPGPFNPLNVTGDSAGKKACQV
jgi:hypothetical protein